MRIFSNSLWAVTRNSPTLDPHDLLAAVESECAESDHDVRTRLLIRDSLRALAGFWGEATLSSRLSEGVRQFRYRVEADDLGERGFPTLARRLMDRTTADDVVSFLTELGRLVREPTRLVVGGSTSLILRDLLRRQTDDIDAVDEIPATLRQQHVTLDQLADRYGLRLAHFQSHYLPRGWENRITSFGVFGLLAVSLVDPVDLFVAKVFSKRTKDLDDCRILLRELERASILDRLKYSADPLRADAPSLQAAESNWEVLFHEPLPQPESA